MTTTIEQAARVLEPFVDFDDIGSASMVLSAQRAAARAAAHALHEAGMLVSGERRGDVSMLLIEFANAIADANMERRIECLKVFSERITALVPLPTPPEGK